MPDLSTMDIEWSPDMGGKEGLSALGYSRIRPMAKGGYPRECWQKDSTASWEVVCIAIDSENACKFTVDRDNDWESPSYMSVQEMASCIKRCGELEEDTD